MINLIIKTCLVYFFLLLTMRLLGKKQAGQLQPHELVITLLIAEVASTPLDSPETPLIYGITPAVTLLILYYLVNTVCMKWSAFRHMFCGKPSLLIHNGKVMDCELKRLEYSVWNLLEQLRISGSTDIAGIEFAILETNGQLSVMAKRGAGQSSDYITVAVNGRVHNGGRNVLGLSVSDVRDIARNIAGTEIADVFLMMLTSDGKVFLQDMSGCISEGSCKCVKGIS